MLSRPLDITSCCGLLVGRQPQGVASQVKGCGRWGWPPGDPATLGDRSGCPGQEDVAEAAGPWPGVTRTLACQTVLFLAESGCWVPGGQWSDVCSFCSLVMGHFFPKHQRRGAAGHRLPEPAALEPGRPVRRRTCAARGGRPAPRGQAGGGPLGGAVAHQGLPGKAGGQPPASMSSATTTCRHGALSLPWGLGSRLKRDGRRGARTVALQASPLPPRAPALSQPPVSVPRLSRKVCGQRRVPAGSPQEQCRRRVLSESWVPSAASARVKEGKRARKGGRGWRLRSVPAYSQPRRVSQGPATRRGPEPGP